MPSAPASRDGQDTVPKDTVPKDTVPKETVPKETVRRALEGLVRRARLVAFGTVALRVTFWALLGAVGLAVLLEGEGIPLIGAVATGLGLAVALSVALLRAHDPVRLAKRLDDHADLDDRLSSAAHFFRREGGVAEAIIEDAASHVGGATPGEVLPFHVPREAFFLPVPVIFLALAGPLLFPPPPPPPAAFTEAVDRRRAALEEFIEAEATEPSTPLREESLDRLRELARQMKKRRASKRSLLESTGKVMAKIRSSKKKLIQKQRLASRSLLERMKKVPLLEPIAEQVEATLFADAIEALEEVLRDIDDGKVGPEDLGDVQKSELDSLLKRLRSLGRNIKFVNKVLQFLEEIEGEIGELSDMIDPEDLEFWQNPERQPRRRRERPPPGDREGPRRNDDWGRGTTESPFGDPNRTPTDEADPEGVKAREGRKGKSASSTLKSTGESAQSGLTYRERYAKFKQMAEDVLYREEIPIGYREYIKRYFDRIQPQEEE